MVDDVDGNIKLFAYEDDDKLCFYTGTSSDARITTVSSRYGFYAMIDKEIRVTIDGSPAYGGGYEPDYRATSNIDFSRNIFGIIKKIIIIYDQSSHKYAHDI